MAIHIIKIIERYNGIKDHTGIIVYTPEDVMTDEVIASIKAVMDQQPEISLNDLLNRSVSARDNWKWYNARYDAVVRLPAIFNSSNMKEDEDSDKHCSSGWKSLFCD